MTPTHLYDLPRPKLGETEPAQRLHVHEDIRRTFAARQETEAAHPVEPLHHGPLPVALRLHHDMGPLGELRGMDRRALVHAENAEGLQPFRTAQHLANDPGPLVRRLIAASPQTGDVQQHVRMAIVRNDESVPLGCIEPLDVPGDLEDIETTNLIRGLNMPVSSPNDREVVWNPPFSTPRYLGLRYFMFVPAPAIRVRGPLRRPTLQAS